jgi:hypothetical protein
MKRQFPLLAALLVSTSAAFAGSFGPGPWANGAYYQGQFDGKYTAAMYGTNVSGVLAFGLEGGTFTTGTTGVDQVGTNNVVSTISVDPLQNYFLAFVEGRTYAGTCIAQVNNNANVVSGSLFNGQGPITRVAFTNTVVTFNTNAPPTVASSNNTVTFEDRQNTCSGGFTANVTSDKAVIAFVGNNTGTLAESLNGIPITTNKFSLNGLKTSDNTTSAVSTNSTP